MQIFALYTDNHCLDLICGDIATAKSEARDLRDMGCKVRTLRITGTDAERAAYDIDERLRDNKGSGRKHWAELAAKYDAQVNLA